MEITEKQIRILSGEKGSVEGTVEIYFGKMTQRAIKSRLTRERCKGTRWAMAIQYDHDSLFSFPSIRREWGIDLETGMSIIYPELG